jgi:hypothetical protein
MPPAGGWHGGRKEGSGASPGWTNDGRARKHAVDSAACNENYNSQNHSGQIYRSRGPTAAPPEPPEPSRPLSPVSNLPPAALPLTPPDTLASTISRQSDIMALARAQERSDSIRRELLSAIRSAETIILDMGES